MEAGSEKPGVKQLQAVFEQAAGEFGKVQQDIDRHEKASQEQFKKLVTQASKAAPDSGSELLAAFLEPIRKKLDEQITEWDHNNKSHKENTDFRKRHGWNSMLLYIFGQVKSGKSSLGNYLIHGKHDPKSPEDDPKHPEERRTDVDAILLTDDKDKAQAFSKAKKLKIDYIEATTDIQLLMIPGLTLVDSPGIHSATPENGKLAQDYLDCADLVLFVTKQPGSCTRSEAEEISKIPKKIRNSWLSPPNAISLTTMWTLLATSFNA